MANWLRRMVISKITLCDQGMNPEAHVTLFKRKPEQAAAERHRANLAAAREIEKLNRDLAATIRATKHEIRDTKATMGLTDDYTNEEPGAMHYLDGIQTRLEATLQKAAREGRQPLMPSDVRDGDMDSLIDGLQERTGLSRGDAINELMNRSDMASRATKRERALYTELMTLRLAPPERMFTTETVVVPDSVATRAEKWYAANAAKLRANDPALSEAAAYAKSMDSAEGQMIWKALRSPWSDLPPADFLQACSEREEHELHAIGKALIQETNGS